MPFEVGNQLSKKADHRGPKIFRDALMAALKRANAEGVEAVQRIADKLAAQAEAGDMQAIALVAERSDGKVAQAIEGKMEHTLDDTVTGLLEEIAANGRRIYDRG